MTDYADLLEADYNFLIAFNLSSESKSKFKKYIKELLAEIQAERIFCKSRKNELSILYDIVTSVLCIFFPHLNNSRTEYIILQSYKTKLVIDRMLLIRF